MPQGMDAGCHRKSEKRRWLSKVFEIRWLGRSKQLPGCLLGFSWRSRQKPVFLLSANPEGLASATHGVARCRDKRRIRPDFKSTGLLAITDGIANTVPTNPSVFECESGDVIGSLRRVGERSNHIATSRFEISESHPVQ